MKTKKELVEQMRHQITEKSDQALKALLRIHEYQTESEQRTEDTHIFNGVGFTKADAKVLTSLVNFHKKTGFLTPKQMKLLQHRIGKYAGQLVNISIDKGLIKKTPDGYIKR